MIQILVFNTILLNSFKIEILIMYSKLSLIINYIFPKNEHYEYKCHIYSLKFLLKMVKKIDKCH